MVLKHEGRKWILYSKSTKKKLGTFSTKKAAVEREHQINYWKHVRR